MTRKPLPVSLAMQPLVAANLAALDTETTGLDIERDRLLQVGAIRIRNGHVVEDDRFESLVDAGVEVPPAAFAVHGISRDMLTGAPAFAELAPVLDDWLGDSIIVGYAIGFDIAILEREHGLAKTTRSSRDWSDTPCLDLVLLARRVLPALPDLSLDSIANYLGISIQQRHSAMGDAIAAAEVFLALLSHLRKAGIRTVGEALRLCRDTLDALPGSELPPWERRRRAPGDGLLPDEEPLPSLDAGHYRFRVLDRMSRDVEVMTAGATAREALGLMLSRGVSSVFVRIDDDELDEDDALRPEAAGIVTERDLLRAIDRDPDSALSLSLGDLASKPLRSVQDDEFVYRAAGRMARERIRHLAVHDARGRVVGALSARDLLGGGGQAALQLDDGIDRAESVGALVAAWSSLAPVSRGLLEQGVDARDIAAVISHELRALTARACVLAQEDMEREGLGAAPRSWAMLVLGSGGRGESLLAMDQDNAIVYADEDDSGIDPDTVDDWFAELGRRVADTLDLAGVPYCKGGVMAKNAAWRRPLEAWRGEVATWLRRQTPEDLLNTDIFFDARVVHGDRGLGDALLDDAFTRASASKSFLSLLRLNACRFTDPTGLFGRLKLEDGRLDAKLSGLLPVFSAARTLAIEHRVRRRSTRGRLESWFQVLEPDDPMVTVGQNLIEVHRILLGAMLAQQVRDLANGISPSSLVAPGEMTAPARQRFRWALERVNLVANALGDPLGRG